MALSHKNFPTFALETFPIPDNVVHITSAHILLARTVTWPYLTARESGKCSPAVWSERKGNELGGHPTIPATVMMIVMMIVMMVMKSIEDVSPTVPFFPKSSNHTVREVCLNLV